MVSAHAMFLWQHIGPCAIKGEKECFAPLFCALLAKTKVPPSICRFPYIYLLEAVTCGLFIDWARN